MARSASATTQKSVYVFSTGHVDGRASMTDKLGGKGANLAEMAMLGLPVPPGFTVSADVCTYYYANNRQLPESLRPELDAALELVSQAVGARFGDVERPLLVSVRSGSRASMPGMMDTILNLGLNDETVEGLARRAGDTRFAYDSYRRFIQMYSNVVLGVGHGIFEDILENYKNINGLSVDTDLTADDWREIIASYKRAVVDEIGKPFPQDTNEQLWGAMGAVLGSWQNARAITYRKLHNIPESWGTAVTVQAMVFGNLGETSATGVAFTRNPSTGEDEIYGEFLLNAQGEDVVAGIRTPQPLTERARAHTRSAAASLETLMPETYRTLVTLMKRLETHYRDMQDVEFTVEAGRLWILQTRTGKRTTDAALQIAVDLASEGTITHEEAVMRVEPASLDQLLHPTIDPSVKLDVITTGLPASPGAASGEIVFSSDAAEAAKSKGRNVILVRLETSPEDIHGMHAAAGVLTARGGMTSHAAVVARGMGRPCVAGAGALRIDSEAGRMTVGSRAFKAGDTITIDGGTGQVLAGLVQMRQPELSGSFATLMGWADEIRRLGVRANADTPRDAQQAREFGAEGIGLCRTEHMFFEESRILAVREMILASDEQMRLRALDKLLPAQRSDFEELFEIMDGLPVTIRLLDPPLHEFLPHEAEEQTSVAAALDMPIERLKARLLELQEFNPMLGFRGCRLSIRYPEITRMQARAIFEAAANVGKRTGKPVKVEVMVPLVAYRGEFDLVRDMVQAAAAEVAKATSAETAYEIGTMIELPRAALRAGEIARGETGAQFFSFGTNDLTQTTLGLSRDDAAPILTQYAKAHVFPSDPFVSIDQDGVGELVRIGTQRGREARPGLKVGVCGEHGGDPASVAFFHGEGLDYVSCSPFRVPIARLAAAQAAIEERSAGQRQET